MTIKLDLEPKEFNRMMLRAFIAYAVLAILAAFLLGALLSAYLYTDMEYKERIIQGQNMTPDRLCYTSGGKLAYCAKFIDEDCRTNDDNRIMAGNCANCEQITSWTRDDPSTIA